MGSEMAGWRARIAAFWLACSVQAVAGEAMTIRDVRYEQPETGLGQVVVDYAGSDDGVDIRRVGDEVVAEFRGASIPDRMLGSFSFDDPKSPLDTIQITRLPDRIQMVMVYRVGVRKFSNFQNRRRYVLGFQQDFEKLFEKAAKAVVLPADENRVRVRNVVLQAADEAGRERILIELSDEADGSVRQEGRRLFVEISGASLPERLRQEVIVPEGLVAVRGAQAQEADGNVRLVFELAGEGWQVEQAPARAGMLLTLVPGQADAAPAAEAVCVSPPRDRPVRQAAAPAAGTVFRDCPDCPAMVVIPPGRFEMGASAGAAARSAELPRRSVAVAGFALGRSEVTWGEYRRFLDASGRKADGVCRTWDPTRGTWANVRGFSWDAPGYPQSDAHPVVCVSWEDAWAYAAWLSVTTGEHYRLPSEAEWEYAARAGERAAVPWSGEPSAACRYGNLADQTVEGQTAWAERFPCRDNAWFPAPTGRYRANALGLHDMLGNVWEWTEDCWNPSYANAAGDDRPAVCGRCDRRVLRGAAWNTMPASTSFAHRGYADLRRRGTNMGFRVARELD